MIKLTVSLPLYKNGDIAWLALDSLTRQLFPKHISYEWELIIFEDEIKPIFGKAEVDKYLDVLNRVGCKRVYYVLHKRRLGLNQKWVQIAQSASSTSKVMVLQDADCYSNPWRLHKTFEHIVEKEIDWVESNRAVFYDIQSAKFAEYRKPTKTTGLNIGVNINLLKNIYTPEKARMTTGLNKWLLIMMQEQKKGQFRSDHFRDECWKFGLDTNGCNHAMNKIIRGEAIQELIPPYYEYDGDERKCCNGNSFIRLREMKDE